MGFIYTVELQNIDTGEKFQHQVFSLKKDQIYNEKEEINYASIVQFILLYDPQCDRDMLLIMYKEKDTWTLMLPEYSLDLKKLVASDEVKRSKIGSSKIGGSKIITSNSQIQFSMLNSNKQPQKSKTLLQIRYQCQLWVDEPEGLHERILNQSYQRSMFSLRDSKNVNLTQKVKEVKNKINEIEKISHELHDIQANAIGINVFWANPYFATDGIQRKYLNPDSKKNQNNQGKKLLKNSVKCIPYVNMIAQQVKQSNKKIVLNIDQFNHQSFSLRNIFNVVYLVCHTEVTQINKQDVQEKFNLDPNEIWNENVSRISEESSSKSPTFGDENDKDKSGVLENMEHIAQNEDRDESDHKRGMQKFKKTQSREVSDDEELAQIDEEQSSDNMTQRKQSCDHFFSENAQENYSVPYEFTKAHSQDNGLLQSRKFGNRNPIQYHNEDLQRSQLKKAFDLDEQNNLVSVYNEENFSYKKMMHEKSKPHRNRVSRSNSIKSVSSKGNQRKSRSRSKKGFERQSINNIHKKIQNSHQLYDLELGNIARSKKHQKKMQKKERNKQKTAQQEKQKKNEEKKAITYLIGQNKQGELQKITSQDLDVMLKQKMLQNIELFIIHTSYPDAHLQMLKKYANNILIINSNPIYPESCTFFFLKYFFKYLFETKNIRYAHEKALMETCFLYLDEPSEFFQMRFADLYKSEKELLEKFKFDPVMQNINKKHVNVGGYLCCCYHQHEDWCIFKKNKSTSKYADAHYKFHVNRCQCYFSNPMIHSCESKKQTLGEYNIIDKREYYSKTVYNCCCLGLRLGKYKERRKNKKCFDAQNQDDPHQITHKFVLVSAYDSMSQKTNKQNPQEDDNKKEMINFEQGSVQGAYNEKFSQSMKYLNGNDLLGNSQVIAELLSFFAGNNQNNPYESQIRSENRNQNPTMTNNPIQQRGIISQTDQLSKLSSQQPWACNMYGQNSSGRKTISKYLAHLMIVKKYFEKIVFQNFSKIEELKYIEVNENVPTFYILIYKPTKKHQQSKVENLKFYKNNLPSFIKCIIITNKQIVFDNSIKNISISPNPLNNQQMKTYVKLYQHLTPQEKNKLNEFVKLTNLYKNSNKNHKEENDDKSMKIYANQIDSYEIISIIRKSNYQKIKSSNYLESVSKINPISLPAYIFISGILSEALKQLTLQEGPSSKKRRQAFIEAMNVKLRDFMNENKAFYILFDPKRNKKKSKKQKNEIESSVMRETQDQDMQLSRLASLSSKQNQNQEQRSYKQEVIKIVNISKFHQLLYQNFRKQISLRPLDCMKAYIYYTKIEENHFFSLESSIFSKGSLNLYSRNSQDSQNYRTRKICYENEFFQATSLNKNSLFTILLGKQMNEYVEQYNNDKLPKFEQRIMSSQLKERSPLLKKPLTEENRSSIQVSKFANQISQCHKQSYSEFFSAYVQSFRIQNLNQSSRFQSEDRQSKESSSRKQIKDSQMNFTPKKELYGTSKYLKSESLPSHEKKIENAESKKKHDVKQKGFDFQEDQKHLHCIMSAGLVYLRSAVCSHVIYSLFDKTTSLELLKSGLILINNALILMKTPHFKHDESQLSKSWKLADIDSADSENRQDVHSTQKNSEFEHQETENSLIFRNRSHKKSSFQGLGLLQSLPSQQKEKNQPKSLKSQIQNELNRPFSIKGLLYLLFKIRQRFDRLILHFPTNQTNEENKDQLNQVKKLSIVAQFFILQLHLMEIAKGKDYEEATSKLQKSQKVEKYLSQIFYDKGRSLNYLKECLRGTNLPQSQTGIILNQVLSAYVMIITNYGRKKINENMRKEIDRLKKNIQEKTVEKDGGRKLSCSEIERNKIQKKKQILTPKMKILQKISQNKDIYDQMENMFSKFECEKIHQLSSIKLIGKKSTDSNSFQFLHKNDSKSSKSHYQHESQRSKSHQISHMSHFQRQTEVYQALLGYWHTFDASISQLKPHKLYQVLQRQHSQLRNNQFVHTLRFCSRYINEFYTDLLNKIESQLKLMNEKFVMFFSADPIEYDKPFEGSSSSKQHLPEYTQSWKNKKQVQQEGDNRTIILPMDYERLNLTQKISLPKKLQHHRAISANEDKTSLQYSNNNSPSHSNLSSTIILTNNLELVNPQSSKHSNEERNPYDHFYIKKKLNQQNIRWLEHSMGCNYLCIDTTVGVNDGKNWVIGESEQGEMIIFKTHSLAEMIDQIPAKVVFICLHNAYLAEDMINMIGREKHKEVVYFNFMNGIGTYFSQSGKERKLSSSFSSSFPSNTSKNEIKTNLRLAYYRMVARKVIHLILERLVNDISSQFTDFMKLYDAIKHVAHNYEFSIRNEEKQQTVFYLSNQELRKTVIFFSQKEFRFDIINDNPNPNAMHFDQQPHHQQPSKLTQIILSQQNILSVQQVRQVKRVLKDKCSQRESKTPIKIQHLNSFNKLYNIFQYYLQDKEHYELFQHVDMDESKNPSLPLKLNQTKSGQSHASVPETISRDNSKMSIESAERRKKDKKHYSRIQPEVKYSHKWKSQFVNKLVKKNLLNWFLSNKKCFIMFSNSDLMNEKGDKHEEWARTLFQNLFKMENCDNGEHLHRVVTEVKIGILKKGQKKISSTASLIFMENNNKYPQ